MSKPKLMTVAFEDAEICTTVAQLAVAEDGLVAADDQDLQEARDDAKQIDTLVSTAQRVETIGQAFQGAAQQDGMGHSEAQAIDVAVGELLRVTGIDDATGLSLEGFAGDRIQRVQACYVALEELGEDIRRIVKRIIAWIKHVAQVSYDLIERIMRGANSVIDQADRMYKAASALSVTRVDPTKLGQIEKGPLLNFFNESGRPMAAREISHAFGQYCDHVNAAFNGGHLLVPAAKALSEVDSYVNQHGEKALDIKAMESIAAKATDELVKSSLGAFTPKHQEGGDLMTTQLPFGNAALLFSFHHGHELPDVRVGFTAAIHSSPVSGAAPLKYLTPQEVMSMMSMLTAQMGRGIYRDGKNIQKALFEISRRVEKQSLLLSDRQRLAGASVIPTLHLIRTMCEASTQLTRLLYAYSGVCTRRILSYSRESILAHHKARMV